MCCLKFLGFYLKKENTELSKQLVSLRESEAAAKEMVKSLEEAMRNSEKERMKDQAFKVSDDLYKSVIITRVNFQSTL